MTALQPILRTMLGKFQVACADCDEATADAFVACFESVWRQLPEVVRAVCSDHWMRHPGCPVFRFQSFAPYQNGVSGGNVRNKGCELRYNADIFPILPDTFRQAVIAHEIGHVFLIALQEPIHYRAQMFEDIVSCEYLARHLTELWGFDQMGICEWLERDLRPGIPQLRATVGEERMSAVEYQSTVDRLMLRWGKLRGCGNLPAALKEHDRLLKEKDQFFQVGTIPDSEFAVLPNRSIDVIQRVAHGTLTLADLKTQLPG